MNKLFKITVVAAVTFTAAGAFAGPRHHNKHHKGNDGVRLAADIINLVDSSLRLLTGTPRTVVVAPQPAVVVAPPPPPAQVIVTAPPPPRRPNTIIINNPPPRRHPQPHKPNHRPQPRRGKTHRR